MLLLSVLCLTGEPRGSQGSMIGVINGQKFGMATLNISVRQQSNSEVPAIWGSISHIPASVGMSGVGAGTHAGPTQQKRLVQGLVPGDRTAFKSRISLLLTGSHTLPLSPNKATAFEIRQGEGGMSRVLHRELRG